MPWVSVARSDTGPLRQLNEDRLVDLPEAGIWAVADGMGGHHAGDVAAQMVADAIIATATIKAPPAAADLGDALQSVNSTLLAQASISRGTSGSTIVALLADRGHYTCLWAGDSRAYSFRDGRLIPISRDHSLVQQMVDAGALSPAEARVHPRSNVITRAIGVAEPLELETGTGTVAPGDLFLLCSDGLTGALQEGEIVEFLTEARANLEVAADAMLAAAIAKPARDNVTFILIAAG